MTTITITLIVFETPNPLPKTVRRVEHRLSCSVWAQALVSGRVGWDGGARPRMRLDVNSMLKKKPESWSIINYRHAARANALVILSPCSNFLGFAIVYNFCHEYSIVA